MGGVITVTVEIAVSCASCQSGMCCDSQLSELDWAFDFVLPIGDQSFLMVWNDLQLEGKLCKQKVL